MEEILSRNCLLLGEKTVRRLRAAAVLVVGVGGVGSHAAEALARSGVGRLVLVDSDRVELSNLNRQLQATTQTLGQPKAMALAQRLRQSAPLAGVEVIERFLLPDGVASLLDSCGPLEYVLDAVDTVSAKLALAVECARRGLPLISCMGAGNKLDPGRFRVSDIYNTGVCPLCRVMRRELRRRGVAALDVVWSDEPPVPPEIPSGVEDGLVTGGEEPAARKRNPPGSVPFVPPVAGLIAAGWIVRKLAGNLRA